MATATLLNEGLDDLTKLALGINPPFTPTLRLFVNNPAISQASTLGTFVQCATPGYADVPLTPANWSGSSAGGVATYTYPPINFNFGANAGTTTVFGAVLFNGLDAKGMWAFDLDQAYAVPAAGGTLTVNLTWQDHQC